MNSEEALSRIKRSYRIAMACLGIDKQDIETEEAIKIIEKELKVLEMLKKNKPPQGLVQALTVTEKQFSSMEMILGEFQTDTINTDERLIEL